jgi:hypothetical protein
MKIISMKSIVDKMREIGSEFDVYALWKTHKVGHSQNTIKRVLEWGRKQGIIEHSEKQTKKGTIFYNKLV